MGTFISCDQQLSSSLCRSVGRLVSPENVHVWTYVVAASGNLRLFMCMHVSVYLCASVCVRMCAYVHMYFPVCQCMAVESAEKIMCGNAWSF